MTSPWPIPATWPDLPAEGPATVEAVTAETGPLPASDVALVTAAVDAVNAAVRGWNCAAFAVAQPAWPADIAKGANMLAAQLYRRRNSPNGVEAFGELGPVYVQRRDPHIAMLLHIGSHAYPQIG